MVYSASDVIIVSSLLSQKMAIFFFFPGGGGGGVRFTVWLFLQHIRNKKDAIQLI